MHIQNNTYIFVSIKLETMNFKSLPQLLDYFKEESTCIEYYEQVRWNGYPVCPHCDSEKVYKTKRGHRCGNKECRKDFTVRVGTIFENSNISFRIWFGAIFLATTHKKGISSVQLGLDLGIPQKTAWFVLHRVREMLKVKEPKLLGGKNMVEVDETYVGGKNKFKHYGKKRSIVDNTLTNEGKPYAPKKMVVGIIERNGQVVLKHVASTDLNNICSFINKHVSKGSTIYSDEAPVYTHLKKFYTHDNVKHP